MNEIRHRIEIHTQPDELYKAITERDGLASWWTPMVEAAPEERSVAMFRFGDGSVGPDMKITELEPGKRAVWLCVAGPWVDHEFVFDIDTGDKGAVLRFAHKGWADAGDFYMHCNAKWGFFLGVSLKKYLETGTGEPHPNDPDL
jgi:uncharacterized protein YndB with AHSA1/START domain